MTKIVCDRCGNIIENESDDRDRAVSITVHTVTRNPYFCHKVDLCNNCQDVVLAVLEPLPKSDIGGLF